MSETDLTMDGSQNEKKKYRKPDYVYNAHFEPGATLVSAHIQELKADKGLCQSKEKCKKAKNATINLKITKDGNMGTVIIMAGKIEEYSYQVNVDSRRVGHTWMEEPGSYFWVEDGRIVILLKKEPNGQ